MPYLSALKFFSKGMKPTYLSLLEQNFYTKRSKEAQIVSMIKNSYNNFFVLSGPKKAGKSALIRHMADFPFKNQALYIKLEQKLLQTDELERILAKAVGYHSFYEESIPSSIFCFWRMFQERKIDRHSLESYLERVGGIYKKLNKGKLPILIIDGVSSLRNNNLYSLDDMAYMAKSLADSRSMIIVFGLLEDSNTHLLNSRGYNISKQRIYLPYINQQEVIAYLNNAIDKNHCLRDSVLSTILNENNKIYGGNFQYINLLISRLQDVKTEKEISKETKEVREIIKNEIDN